MSAGPSVLVPDLRQLGFSKASGELDQRGPQTTVHIGDLAIDQLAHQHLVALADGVGNPEDLVTLRVAPPAPPNRAAGNLLRQAGDRPSCRLQDDAVSPDEGQSLFRAHRPSLTICPPNDHASSGGTQAPPGANTFCGPIRRVRAAAGEHRAHVSPCGGVDRCEAYSCRRVSWLPAF